MNKFATTVTAVMFLAAPVMADTTVNIGSFTLGGGENSIVTIDDANGMATAFEITFQYVPDAGGLSWGSDMCFMIGDEDQVPYVEAGGYDVFWNAQLQMGPWPFDGPDSALAGEYTAYIDFGGAEVPVSGSFTLGVMNGYSAGGIVEYNDVTVTVVGVDGGDPPPAEICNNGIDDDGDGLVDCEDDDCDDDPACEPPPPCPSDLDGNGSVGFSDLLLILSEWGPCTP